MTKIYGYSKAHQKTAIIPQPDGSQETEPEGYLPMLTWADWDLLQELHKEQAAKKRRFAALQKGELPEDTDLLSALEATPARVKVVRETIRSEVRHRYDNAEIPVNGSTTDRLANEVRHAEIAVAELQDQIKDREAKWKYLEDTNSGMAETIRELIELKNKYFNENRQLSKSLQHYRNAFFTDQRDSGGTIPCPPDAVRPGGKRP